MKDVLTLVCGPELKSLGDVVWAVGRSWMEGKTVWSWNHGIRRLYKGSNWPRNNCRQFLRVEESWLGARWQVSLSWSSEQPNIWARRTIVFGIKDSDRLPPILFSISLSASGQFDDIETWGADWGDFCDMGMGAEVDRFKWCCCDGLYNNEIMTYRGFWHRC